MEYSVIFLDWSATTIVPIVVEGKDILMPSLCKKSCYRFHIASPIPISKSLSITLLAHSLID